MLKENKREEIRGRVHRACSASFLFENNLSAKM